MNSGVQWRNETTVISGVTGQRLGAFSHNEIDLNRSGSRGVVLLKAYLEFAASGGAKLPHGENAGEVPLNALEADIRDALAQHGVLTRPQYGASRYRIDLVAMHPNKPGRPVLAIECDGATYHSSATARDRDRARQAHLQRLGWRFHRIWSTDWFFSREQEIERALSAYEEAVQRADLADAEKATMHGIATPPTAAPPKSEPNDLPRPTPARKAQPLITVRDSIDQYPDRELLTIAEWVVSDGLLRTNEELIEEIFKVLPFSRMGARIRGRLENVVQQLQRRRGKK